MATTPATPQKPQLKQQPQAAPKPQDDDEGAYSYDPRKEQERWQREMVASEKELRKFIESGRKVIQAYLDFRTGQIDNEGDARMNLFWSNVQVMKSSLYAKPPKVDVARTFKDENDDVARVAGTILERILNSGIESDNSDFDRTVKHCIEDFLLPGMGQLWIRYEVETTKMQTQPVVDPQTGQELVASVEFDKITHEDALTDYVYWQDFRYAPCRIWEECRWVARRVYLSRRAAAKRFGEAKAKLLPAGKVPKRNAVDAISPQNDPWNRIEIWEIWCKEERAVYWYCPGHDQIVDIKQDPLGLEGFFPCPEPLVSNTTTSNFIARADYAMAQDQYVQIDELTTRIKYLTRACKVVGAYDKSATALGRIFQEGLENQMVPVDSWMAFAEKGGIKGAMEFVPIEQIAAVIDKLTVQRDTIKAALYEVMGISDIMRGATDPTETLGAQEIKAQFGSARLQSKQSEISIWAAGAQRIKAQIICRHWQPQTIIDRSNIMQSTDKDIAQQAVAFLKSGGGLKPQAGQEDAQPQAGGAAQLRYRITIDPDSMSTLDWAAERDARTQAIQAIGQFVSSVTPLLQATGEEAMPIVLQMLKWMMGGFKVGKEIESVLDQAIQVASQPKPEPPPNPVQEAEVAKIKAETKEKEASTDQKMADALKTLGEAAHTGLLAQVNQVLIETGLPALNQPDVMNAMQMQQPVQAPPGAGGPPADAGPPPGAGGGPPGGPGGAPPPPEPPAGPQSPPAGPVPALPPTQLPQGAM